MNLEINERNINIIGLNSEPMLFICKNINAKITVLICLNEPINLLKIGFTYEK